MQINERTFNIIYNDKNRNESLMTIKELKTIEQINKEIDKINNIKGRIVTGLIETEHRERIVTLQEYKQMNLLRLKAVYKHFKHTDKDPLNYLYFTICTAESIYENIEKENLLPMFSVEYTEEKDKIIDVYYNKKDKKYYYYDSENKIKDILVIYKSLYDNHINYGRPLDMFISKVDKEKYPDIEQKFRFELV